MKIIMRATRSKWKIWRHALHITDSDLHRLRSQLEKGAEIVFNPNKKRRQLTISCEEPIIAALITRLQEIDSCSEYTLQNPVLLQSLKGCKQQQWHTDYDPSDHTTGFGLLLALEDDTRFETLEETVRLSRGDLLIFKGDLVHAGSWYDKENIRIHAYWDIVHTRRPNTTYLVHVNK